MPLASLDDVASAPGTCSPTTRTSPPATPASCEPALLEQLKEPLSAVKPMPAVFSPDYVKRLDGPNVKRGANKRELGEQLREDIRRFMREHDCARAVMVWCASTEVYLQPSGVHGRARSVRGGDGARTIRRSRRR